MKTKNIKPSHYEAKKVIKGWIENNTPLHEINARQLDSFLYYYPQDVLRFMSDRKQNKINK